ncbi:MAG: flagellar biosynthesis protein FlhB [Acetivibrio sp.]
MKRIRYNLQFFAKEGQGGEKTEDATSKKLTDARKDGQVAKSQELVMSLQLIGMFLVLKMCITYIGEGMLGSYKEIYGMISSLLADEFNRNVVHRLMILCLKEIVLISLPIYLVAFVVAFAGNIVQVKWKPSLKPLTPKFNKINPVSGMKNLFSKEKLVELIKSLGKIIVIGYVVYNALKDQWGMLMNLYDLPLYDAIALIGNTVVELGLKISYFFLAIALFDVWYQKHKFKEDMKMSKQEIKDEYKQSEGDPQIKGKIRQKMRDVSRQRMMQEVPEADVVITNPTHLAVAVKYDRENSEAPIVVAKGADYLAQKIKEVAKENKVEIVENKPLARMLYYNVEVGNEIPEELYQMVAEVLAYVYGIKGKI